MEEKHCAIQSISQQGETSGTDIFLCGQLVLHVSMKTSLSRSSSGTQVMKCHLHLLLDILSTPPSCFPYGVTRGLIDTDGSHQMKHFLFIYAA